MEDYKPDVRDENGCPIDCPCLDCYPDCYCMHILEGDYKEEE